MTHRIAVIPGDGIGTEVVPEGLRVLDAAARDPQVPHALLVLDDLGAEKASEWVAETLNLIVNSRYSEKRLDIGRHVGS